MSSSAEHFLAQRLTASSAAFAVPGLHWPPANDDDDDSDDGVVEVKAAAAKAK
jgi:hypothetical protein